MITIAVLSDIHAYEAAEADYKPSHVCLTAPDSEPTKNPVAGLRKLISEQGLTADIVLCGGDLADKASPSAIRFSWDALHQIKSALRARHAVGTVGNHDVDSRYQHNAFDPKGFLQSLDPPFPFCCDTFNDRFWARNFAVLEEDCYRLITLNSSAFHGGGDEHKHGRISDYTLAGIRRALEGISPKQINVLLCHHHPQQHMELGLGDYDVMRNGQLLLDLLGSGDFGEWLVIHGHKHHPKLAYASGGSAAPTVFSCGSFSATLYSELQTVARNQFYLLELPYSQYDALGFVGRFRAWDWASGHGWIPARANSGLPHVGGFGFRGNLNVLAKRMQKLFLQATSWDNACRQLPELEFLIPGDMKRLFEELKRVGLGVQSDSLGQPVEIGSST